MRSLFEAQAISVGELCRRIRRALRGQFTGPVRVLGEISKCKKVAGNLYFSLKDREGFIDCVCFDSTVRQLNVELPLADGVAVEVLGFVDIWEPKSSYQLRVTDITPVGKGALHLAFERLKAALDAEGLFAASRKRPIPAFIRDVAIVTSKNAAALADFVTTCRRRGAHVTIWVVPAPVQGAAAAPALARAIASAGRLPVDVVVVARGGGSIEDLWAFNTEAVARAIAASPKPVISAVGHETDVTIADFVADLRAATPTAAAEFVAREREALLARIAAAEMRLRRALDRSAKAPGLVLHRALLGLERAAVGMIAGRGQTLDRLALGLGRRDPRVQIRGWRDRVAEAGARLPVLGLRTIEAKRASQLQTGRDLTIAWRHFAKQRASQLNVAFAKLSALGPRQTLERGYAIVYGSSGAVLTSAAAARLGENIDVELKSGRLGAVVKSRKDDHGKDRSEAK